MIDIKFNGCVALVSGLNNIQYEALKTSLLVYYEDSLCTDIKGLVPISLDKWSGGIDKYLVSPIMQDGSFTIATGLIVKLIHKLKNWNLKFNIERLIEKVEFQEKPITSGDLTLKEHQVKIIAACLKGKRGYIEASTGSGKSICLAQLCRVFSDSKVLVSVPNKVLLEQLTSDISNWCQLDRSEIGQIGDNTVDLSKNITVAIADTILSRALNTKAKLHTEMIEYLDSVGVWCCDECLPGNTLVLTDKGAVTLLEIIKSPSSYLVLSYNEKANIYEYKPVINTFKKGIKSVSKVNINNRGKVISTSNHLYLTGRGWVELKDLVPGDWIRAKNTRLRVLSFIQKSIVVGSILGDGCLIKISDYSYRLRVVNGEKQEAYLVNKSKAFPNCKKGTFTAGYTNSIKHMFCTQQFYLPIGPLESKVKWAIENIDDLALSIMWGDDGNLCRDKYGNPRQGRLYSCMSNKEDCLALSNKLNNKYGMSTKVITDKASKVRRADRGNDLYIVWFNKESVDILLNIIDKFAQPSLEYKYENPKIYDLSSNYTTECSIVKSIDIDIKETEVYDIEVADNHNFLVKSLNQTCKKSRCRITNFSVVHNCHMSLNVTGVTLASLLPSTDYRLAFSATPWEKLLLLEGLFGPQLYKYGTEEAIAKK